MRVMHRLSNYSVVLVLTLAVSIAAYAQRTELKPGFNVFSPEQDVEMGREVAQEAERELQIINDRAATAYIDKLGKALAARAPGEKYPYQFKLVNDKTINAFALPGGFIYINRGTIEAAANEAQLASVVAHEIGHVALRHGTNQVSKAYLTENALGLVGGLLGNDSVGSVIAQMAIGFGADSILLKYSRDAERQADLMGAQILYDAGLDPNGMVGFFETMEAESKGRGAEFLSSHPNPENRITGVKTEIGKLGGSAAGRRTDSAEFRQVKASVARLAAPSAGGARGARDTTPRKPANPSNRSVELRLDALTIQHPDNWQSYGGQGTSVTLAPDGGIVSNSVAYGFMIDVFTPQTARNGKPNLQDATEQLLDELSQSNPNMRVTRNNQRITVGGQRGLVTQLRNDSPVGGAEIDWLVSVLLPNGRLHYFIGVAPESEFKNYQKAFERAVGSVRFQNVS